MILVTAYQIYAASVVATADPHREQVGSFYAPSREAATKTAAKRWGDVRWEPKTGGTDAAVTWLAVA